jgi:hypothetical protein
MKKGAEEKIAGRQGIQVKGESLAEAGGTSHRELLDTEAEGMYFAQIVGYPPGFFGR